MSTRDDFVPKQYMKFLKTLQAGAPPKPAEYVRELIEKELGKVGG